MLIRHNNNQCGTSKISNRNKFFQTFRVASVLRKEAFIIFQIYNNDKTKELIAQKIIWPLNSIFHRLIRYLAKRRTQRLSMEMTFLWLNPQKVPWKTMDLRITPKISQLRRIKIQDYVSVIYSFVSFSTISQIIHLIIILWRWINFWTT